MMVPDHICSLSHVRDEREVRTSTGQATWKKAPFESVTDGVDVLIPNNYVTSKLVNTLYKQADPCGSQRF